MAVGEKSFPTPPGGRSVAGIARRLNERPRLGSLRSAILITDDRLQIQLMNLPQNQPVRCRNEPFVPAGCCASKFEMLESRWAVLMWRSEEVLPSR